MERMVKLADVLTTINVSWLDLRTSQDNIALQEAIRSLPTVDVDLDPQGRGRGTKMDFDEEEKGKNMEMQRLIDANEILKSEHQHYAPMADEYYVTVRDIENAPTVEAIPIEWIKEWANNYCDWSEEKLIEILLRVWNKQRTR